MCGAYSNLKLLRRTAKNSTFRQTATLTRFEPLSGFSYPLYRSIVHSLQCDPSNPNRPSKPVRVFAIGARPSHLVHFAYFCRSFLLGISYEQAPSYFKNPGAGHDSGYHVTCSQPLIKLALSCAAQRDNRKTCSPL
jgi:hypothetical protein